MIPLLVGLAVGLLLFAAVRLMSHRRASVDSPPQYRAEYWIYCNVEVRPEDKDMLEAAVHKSPFNRKGNPAVSHAAALTLSDVRLHIGFAKKERNPMLFRPDIFAESDAEIPQTLPYLLSNSTSIVMVRFVSDREEARPTYLQFVSHVTAAVARLCSANVIWDTEAQTFHSEAGFSALLAEDPDATRFEMHVGVRWSETADEGRAFTRGMAKVGLPDIEFDHQPIDQRTLATFLVGESARQCWQKREVSPCDMEGFGELFEVDFLPARPGAPSHRGWLTTLHAVRKRPLSA